MTQEAAEVRLQKQAAEEMRVSEDEPGKPGWWAVKSELCVRVMVEWVGSYIKPVPPQSAENEAGTGWYGVR